MLCLISGRGFLYLTDSHLHSVPQVFINDWRDNIFCPVVMVLIQGWIYEYICDTGFIKPKQIAALRNQLNDGPINQIQMLSIFNNCVMAKKVSRSLTFSEKKLTKYFPDDYTAKDMEQVIESLLEKWMQEQSC